MREPRVLQDAKVSVRTTLALLWVALMFFNAYGDVLAFYRAENLEGVLAGQLGGMAITPLLLVGSAALMAIPIAMIVLSLTLRTTIIRLANVIVAAIYAVVLATTVVTGDVSAGTAYYLLIAAAEAILLGVIILRAWWWPTQEDNRAVREE